MRNPSTIIHILLNILSSIFIYYEITHDKKIPFAMFWYIAIFNTGILLFAFVYMAMLKCSYFDDWSFPLKDRLFIVCVVEVFFIVVYLIASGLSGHDVYNRTKNSLTINIVYGIILINNFGTIFSILMISEIMAGVSDEHVASVTNHIYKNYSTYLIIRLFYSKIYLSHIDFTTIIRDLINPEVRV
jgi:hypothetical protein